MYVNELL